jgi:parallel beta-helix repeat protein
MLLWGLVLGGCGGGAATPAGDPAKGADGGSGGGTGDDSEDSAAPDAGDTGGDPSDSGQPDDPDEPDDPEAGCDRFLSPTAEPGGDGSEAAPWPSLALAAQDGLLPSSGEVLCLLPGHHGAPRLVGLSSSPPLTLRSTVSREAVVDSLTLERVQGLVVDGLAVDASSTVDTTTDHRPQFLVRGDLDTTQVTLRDVLVQTEDSIETWTWQDWTDRPYSGVDLRGPDNHVHDSLIRNVYHAVSLRGDRSSMVRSVVDNFGGDGIRGLGSGSLYEWNVVRDAYIDEYEVQHDDAFQSYRLEGEDLRVSDVVIRHNQFLLFTDPITDFVRDEQLVGTLMQGVIITDGYADGWVVENNLVVNAQAHGISLYGGRNCRVQGNTVVGHPAFEVSAGPWVRIVDQPKTDHPNFDNTIRNNLAALLTPWDYDDSSLVEGNLQIDDPRTTFTDPEALDFTLAAGSPALDVGVDAELVEVDLDGAPRLQGAGVDVGAYERAAR